MAISMNLLGKMIDSLTGDEELLIHYDRLYIHDHSVELWYQNELLYTFEMDTRFPHVELNIEGYAVGKLDV